jgi:hypothetical protein
MQIIPFSLTIHELSKYKEKYENVFSGHFRNRFTRKDEEQRLRSE